MNRRNLFGRCLAALAALVAGPAAAAVLKPRSYNYFYTYAEMDGETVHRESNPYQAVDLRKERGAYRFSGMGSANTTYTHILIYRYRERETPALVTNIRNHGGTGSWRVTDGMMTEPPFLFVLGPSIKINLAAWPKGSRPTQEGEDPGEVIEWIAPPIRQTFCLANGSVIKAR